MLWVLQLCLIVSEAASFYSLEQLFCILIPVVTIRSKYWQKSGTVREQRPLNVTCLQEVLVYNMNVDLGAHLLNLPTGGGTLKMWQLFCKPFIVRNIWNTCRKFLSYQMHWVATLSICTIRNMIIIYLKAAKNSMYQFL